MTKKIQHDVFGNLKYEYGWVKDKEIYCFNKNRTIQIVIEADENAEFESSQEEAYIKFSNNFDVLLVKAEDAIYKYYQEVCLEYRDRLGDDIKDKIAPIVKSKQEIKELVKPKQILFPMVFDENIREFGILLDCNWEEEHGLVVKFQNEEVVEVSKSNADSGLVGIGKT